SYSSLLPSVHPPWYDAVGVGAPEDEVLVCFASTLLPTTQAMETYAFALPTIRGYFSGVGDLFSAMVLAHFQRPENETEERDQLPDLPHAVSKALLTVQQILLKTHLYTLAESSVSGAATPRPLHHPSSPLVSSVIPSDAELDAQAPLNPTDPKRKAKRMRMRELRVVQERALIADGGQGWPGKKVDWDTILAQRQ
ncbi:hypothetical protein P7C73_g79, partial [Tremellales sp. Uapishka_1]